MLLAFGLVERTATDAWRRQALTLAGITRDLI
jgi:hypothetical protein